MLTAMQIRLKTHLKAAQDSLSILYRQPVASFMTILSIASILTLPAIFLLLTDNVDHLTATWQRDEHVLVYLKPSLASTDEIKSLDQVRRMLSVKEATLKSATDGLRELSQQEGMQDLIRDLPENPLPAVIEVSPALEVNTDALRQKLYTELQAVPFVEQVKADLQWMSRLDAIFYFLSKVTQGLIVLFAAAVIFIIANTLRQAVYNRQEEILVLKLMGAKDSYIVRPFLYSGVFYGLFSALIAFVFISLFTHMLGSAVSMLTDAFQANYVLSSLAAYHMLWLIVFAIVLGWLGACVSVKRQLASIEPYD